MKYIKLFEEIDIDFDDFDWEEEDPIKKLKKQRIGLGEGLKKGDRIYSEEYGNGTVLKGGKGFDWCYICFDKKLPDDIMGDREKNHATSDHGCKYGHGWFVHPYDVYKIIEKQ